MKSLKLCQLNAGRQTLIVRSAALAVAAAAVLLPVGNTAWGGGPGATRERRIEGPSGCSKRFRSPGRTQYDRRQMYSFDISWVDQQSRTYYLADRSNAVVDIVDTKTGTLSAQLQGGFKGFTGTTVPPVPTA